MLKIPNTRVFIDLGFTKKLSEYFGNGKPIRYSFTKFAKRIASKEKLWCEHIFIYTAPPFQGTPPTQDEKERKKRYDKFAQYLNSKKEITLREGRLQKVEGEYRQKGVDSLLVMDLALLPQKNPDIKKIIVVACDTDFVPTIQELRKQGIEVILFSYHEKERSSKFSTSNFLLSECSKVVQLAPEDFHNSQLK